MHYCHKFTVNASLERVSAFHRRSSGMGDITPPPIIVRLHEAPERLDEGSEMYFTLWVGPLPIRWRARIEQVTPNGFIDQQIQGPFSRWEHRHTFQSLSSTQTQVIDEVQAQLKPHLLWGLVGLGMLAGLPLLFAYRGWMTRRQLR